MHEPPDPTFELDRIHVAYLAGPDGALRPAFSIDGRDYDDAAAMHHDLDEAWAALAAHRVVAEFETRPVSGAEPLPAVPSWDAYRRTRRRVAWRSAPPPY